jgi:acetoin utilization deacetylase AcuC-like enzyme
MTLLLSDPRFQLHDTGWHPECAARLSEIAAELKQSGLAQRCTSLPFDAIDETAIIELHTIEVLETVRAASQGGGGRIESDTVVSPASFDVGKLAAGACVAAVDAVLDGRDRNAFCIVRPPGHHATPTQSMGFCLFNSIALAANHALKRGLNRVLIIDWDVHHGNGTQDIFYRDERVMFLSAHRYGFGFYPGTGAADETGAGPGLGWNKNAPLRYGISRREYLDTFRLAVESCAAQSRPDLILISAGFDAHRLDPVGSLSLEVEDFAELSQTVLDVADVHTQGRVVSCLEGGYNVEMLAKSVAVHLESLLSDRS